MWAYFCLARGKNTPEVSVHVLPDRCIRRNLRQLHLHTNRPYAPSTPPAVSPSLSLPYPLSLPPPHHLSLRQQKDIDRDRHTHRERERERNTATGDDSKREFGRDKRDDKDIDKTRHERGIDTEKETQRESEGRGGRVLETGTLRKGASSLS